MEDAGAGQEEERGAEARAYEFFLIFRRLFVNLILSFKEQRLSTAFFLEHEDMTRTEAFEVIELELNFIYDMVYTNSRRRPPTPGLVGSSAPSALPASSLHSPSSSSSTSPTTRSCPST